MSQDEAKRDETWQPRIAAFVCRWCTYAGADLAGTSRLKYPPQIRIIKLPCTGRIDPLFLLRGFQMGADGLLVSGCHPGDCHYIAGNYYARRRWVLFRELLDFVGMDMRRVHFSWVSAAEGAKFVDVVKRVTDSIRDAGPFPGFEPLPGETVALRGIAGRPEAAAPRIDRLEEARRDLEAGAVAAVLGHAVRTRTGIPRARWARTAKEVGAIGFAGGAGPSLAGYLARRLAEDPHGAYGILAGPGELETIEILKSENRIDPARIRVYAQDGTPAAARGGEAWDLYPVPSMDRPADERWSYWTSQFARCVRCNACRESCPLCGCSQCVAQKSRPRWIDASPTPAGNWVWNVTRAFHHAGHCTECESCTHACPAGIPLGALNHHLNRAAEKAFGPREAGSRSPLCGYSLEDAAAAPFIM